MTRAPQPSAKTAALSCITVLLRKHCHVCLQEFYPRVHRLPFSGRSKGTGKSTWIAQHYAGETVYDLLSTSESLRLTRDPSALFREVESQPAYYGKFAMYVYKNSIPEFIVYLSLRSKGHGKVDLDRTALCRRDRLRSAQYVGVVASDTGPVGPLQGSGIAAGR